MSETLYIGSQQVTEVYPHPDGKMVAYVLANNERGELTTEQFAVVAKPTAYDDGRVSVEKWKPTVKKIMEILLEDRMRLMDKDFILQQVDNTIVHNYEKAVAKMFGAEFVEYISLPMLDAVLTAPEADEVEAGSESQEVSA